MLIAIIHVTRKQCVGEVRPGYYYQTGMSDDDGGFGGKENIWQRDLDAGGWCGPYRTEKQARKAAEMEG